jgi:hypothetical protein
MITATRRLQLRNNCMFATSSPARGGEAPDNASFFYVVMIL